MSNVPSGEPPSDIATGSYTIQPSQAIVTSGTNAYCIAYKNVNMGAASGTLTTLYTTEASRGRFIVVAVQLVIQEGFTPAVSPQFCIGYIGASYDQIMSTKTLTAVQSVSQRCGGFFENVSTVFVDTTATSVPASTAIIGRLVSGSAATSDLRSVGLIGFYTG